jgi:hypothetical protein
LNLSNLVLDSSQNTNLSSFWLHFAPSYKFYWILYKFWMKKKSAKFRNPLRQYSYPWCHFSLGGYRGMVCETVALKLNFVGNSANRCGKPGPQLPRITRLVLKNINLISEGKTTCHFRTRTLVLNGLSTIVRFSIVQISFGCNLWRQHVGFPSDVAI